MRASSRSLRLLLGAVLVANVAFAAISTAGETDVTNTVWDQVGGSGAHAGRDDGLGAVTKSTAGDLRLAFATSPNGSVKAGPIGRGGRVFVGDTTWNLNAYDSRTGVRVWRTGTASGVTATAVADQTKVYVVTTNCTVQAFDSETGQLSWSRRVETCADNRGGLLLSGGRLFVPTPTGNLTAITAYDGRALWTVKVAYGPSWSAPATTGAAIVSAWDGGVVSAVDPDTGESLWSRKVPANARGTATVADDRVFIGDDDGGLSKLDAGTGALIWRKALGTSTASPIVRGPLAVSGSSVYVGVAEEDPSSGRVYALDAGTGTQRWARTTGYSTSGVVESDGMVFSAGTDGLLRAHDAWTGESLWSGNAGRTYSPIAILDDGLLLGNEDGKLLRFATPTTAASAPAPTTAPTTAPDPVTTTGGPSGLLPPTTTPGGMRRVFMDDFTASSLNRDDWATYSGIPGSDPGSQWATSHVAVTSGKVVLSTYKDSAYGGKWTSGAINNGPSGLDLASGRYEVRMRFDQARGINGCLLLWPVAGSWPPEIDFAEDRDGDRDNFTTTVHYEDSAQTHKMVHRSRALDMTAWHTYGIQWRGDTITYLVDGAVWATVTGSFVPREAFELAIQTNAVTNGAVKPDSTTPARSVAEIDWVVAYAYV